MPEVIIQCTGISNNNWGVNSFKESNPYSYNARDGWELRAIERALSSLEAAKEKIELLHEVNIPLIEKNMTSVTEIRDFMKKMGIPEAFSVYDYPTKNHKTKKRFTEIAGWTKDVERFFIRSDGYTAQIKRYEEVKASLLKQRDEYTKIGDVTKEIKANEEAIRQDLINLGKYAAKYNVANVTSWEDILDTILEKCKYLNLADAMYQVRCDWNDGCGKVEYALFDSVICEEDTEIISSISDTISRFHEDRDGRVFRDCEWSYGRIFGLVEKSLYDDYTFVVSKVDRS